MKTILLAAAIGATASAASAQVLTMSTTNPGGLSHSIGSAIAKVVTDNTDRRMVVVPAGGSPMPPVAGGEAECGINTAYDVAYYVEGSHYYQAEGAHPALKMAGAVLPSLVAMYVKNDSPVQSISDLKGQRVPGGLNAQLAIGEIYETYLKFGGLTRDDVSTVAAASIVQAADDFVASKNDAFLFSVGTAKVLEVDSAVGGLRAVNVPADDANRKTLADSLPGAYFTELQPSENQPQIKGPTNVITFDLVLFCNEGASEDAVYDIVKSVYGNPAALAESFKAMSRFDPAKMAPVVPGVEYHPGAIRFFEEAGIWPPKG